jgi:hypothetical protein
MVSSLNSVDTDEFQPSLFLLPAIISLTDNRLQHQASLFGFGSKSTDRITINFQGDRPKKRLGSSSEAIALPVFSATEVT